MDLKVINIVTILVDYHFRNVNRSFASHYITNSRIQRVNFYGPSLNRSDEYPYLIQWSLKSTKIKDYTF